MPFSQPLNTLRIDVVHPLAASAAATNNAAGAFTAVSDPNLRQIMDARGYSGVRLIARLGGTVAAASKIRIQYHLGQDINVTTGDAGWTTLGDTPGSHTVGQYYISPIIALPQAAQINGLVLRAGIADGNGAADPTITACTLAFYRDVSQTLEESYLATQAVRNIQGLRQDMRRNATAYKQAVTGGRPVAQIAAVMNQDAAAYLVRIGWQESLEGNAKLINGLNAVGSSIAELIAARAELKAASQTLQSAQKTTGAQINSASDNVLIAVAANDYVF